MKSRGRENDGFPAARLLKSLKTLFGLIVLEKSLTFFLIQSGQILHIKVRGCTYIGGEEESLERDYLVSAMLYNLWRLRICLPLGIHSVTKNGKLRSYQNIYSQVRIFLKWQQTKSLLKNVSAFLHKMLRKYQVLITLFSCFLKHYHCAFF